MFGRIFWWLCLSVCLWLIPITALAQSFYSGKALRILTPSPPGALTDIEARTVGRHLSRHIPGNPSIIVQPIPGGGGINLANYLYNVAKPDGLTIGLNGTLVAFHKILGTRGVKYKVEDFIWLGTFADPNSILIFHVDSPYSSVEAIRNANRPPKLGVPSSRHAIFMQARIFQKSLGVKFDYVFGYSPPEIDLAVERKEIDGRSSTYSTVVARRREWLDQGFYILGIISDKRHKALPKVPTIWELIKDENTRKLVEVAVVPFRTPRAWTAPPGVPQERVQILRQGFLATLKDPKFLADAKRTGLSVVPNDGEQVEKTIRKLTQASPDILKQIREMLRRPK